MDNEVRLELSSGASESIYLNLQALAEHDSERYLSAIDYLLHLGVAEERARELQEILSGGGSAWRVVNVEQSAYQLQRRLVDGVEEAIEEPARTGRPGELLRKALGAAYGQHPEPSTAYREAVRAVEAAAKPIVTPSDGLATLGRMIGEMRAAPERFSVALTGDEGISRVIGMMSCSGGPSTTDTATTTNPSRSMGPARGGDGCSSRRDTRLRP